MFVHPLETELDKVSLEDLESMFNTVSLESFGFGFVNKVMSAKHIQQFFSKAGQFLKNTNFAAMPTFHFNSSDLTSAIAKQGFVDSTQKQIIVPESFIGKWVDYSTALKEAMVKALLINADVIKFNTVLGKIINDPGMLKSSSGLGVSIGGQHLSEDMVKIGKTFFDPNSNHIHRDLGSVIDRSQDLQTTQKLLAETMKLDKSQPASVTLKSVERTVALTETLDKYITNDGSVNKATLQELVTITMDLARDVEAYGTLIYRIRQFSESLKDSVKEIKK